MMMTSAQVINACFTVVEISFYRVYSHPEPLLPIHVPQTCYKYFPLCLIGEQTQTFVVITTVFGFAIGNHFSWAWRFGWRHVAKQRGKWTIEWSLKLSDRTYLMIVFPHWFVQFSKFPISAIHGPRICSNRTLKYNTHHNAIGTTFGETI